MLEKSGVDSAELTAAVENIKAKGIPANAPATSSAAAPAAPAPLPTEAASVPEPAPAMDGPTAIPSAARSPPSDEDIAPPRARTESVIEFEQLEETTTASVPSVAPIAEESAKPTPTDAALTAQEENARLNGIFVKITAKESTKLGISELNEFMAQYPKANVKPHLAKLSPFMKNYVQRNMGSVNTGSRPGSSRTSPVKSAPGSGIPTGES